MKIKLLYFVLGLSIISCGENPDVSLNIETKVIEMCSGNDIETLKLTNEDNKEDVYVISRKNIFQNTKSFSLFSDNPTFNIYHNHIKVEKIDLKPNILYCIINETHFDMSDGFVFFKLDTLNNIIEFQGGCEGLAYKVVW